MPTTRREFMHTAAFAGAALGLARGAAAQDRAATRPADRPLKLLMIGGTGFLGPHTVQAALDRGHTVTLFNRGKTNPHLFPDLEKLVGDRDPDKDAGLSALEGDREWDAVIDTSGYVPRHVQGSAELLADRVKQYVFISTISVYADFKSENIDEGYAVGTLEDESFEEVNGLTYGPLKALCEQAAERALPGRVANIRPGLIVGPGDSTDRFTYWPVRVSRGGEILCPGNHTDPVKYIDARDLAEWTIHCIENDINGVFNAVGPETNFTIGELIYGCKAVTGGDATFTWAPAEFLQEHEVGAWMEMTVWVPPVGDYAGMGTVSRARAFANGMPFRPLADTVRDTLAWFAEQPAERQAALSPEAAFPSPGSPDTADAPRRRAGLNGAKEKRVLAAWHDRPADDGADGHEHAGHEHDETGGGSAPL